MTTFNERSTVLDVCNKLLKGSIKTYQEVQLIWQANKISHPLLVEIMDSTSEFLVLSDSSGSKEYFEESHEYLCIYLAVKVLNKYDDLNSGYKKYLQLTKNLNLSKEIIDNEV